MGFTTPTLKELNDQIRQDIVNAGIPGVNTVLRNSVLGTIGTVQAGLAWSHYTYLGNIARQAVPWTATDDYLAGWGSLKNVYQKAPSAATGLVRFTGLDGVSIPKGTLLRRSDGWSYETLEDAVHMQARIQSVETGVDGNAGLDVVLSLGQPLPGIDGRVVALTVLTGGADLEDQESFRNRVIQAYRISGSEGREQEYILWARELPQVSRVWVGRNAFGTGTVVLWIMCDAANHANDGFPVGTDGVASKEFRYNRATGDQLAVADHIWDRQPVTALVIVCSPIPQKVDFVIADLGQDDTPENRQTIRAALQDMFQREAAPGKVLHPSAWERAIGSITSINQYSILAPQAPVVPEGQGNLPVIGEVTFQ